MNRAPKHIIVKYNKIETNRITFTELEENERIKSQKIAYPRYNDIEKGEGMWNIQLPWIKLNTYGIPQEGQYYPTIESRAFLKVPISNDKESKKLLKYLIEIDNYMMSDEVLIKLFSSKKQADKYKYQPIVRYPQVVEQDSDEENELKIEDDRPPYFKAKIDLDYNTKEVKTQIYRKNSEGSNDYEVDGPYSSMPVTDLEDLRKKYLGYMKNVRLVLHVNKCWASKQAMRPNEPRAYGLTFKIRRAEVDLTNTPSSYAEEDEQPFINDSDSDDEDEDKNLLVKAKNMNDICNKLENDENDDDKDDDDDEDDEDQENDDDDEVVVQQTKKLQVKEKGKIQIKDKKEKKDNKKNQINI